MPRYLLMAMVSMVVYFGIKLSRTLFTEPNVPTMEETYWGAGNPKDDNTEIKPFKIVFKDEVIKDLKMRLENRRPFVQPLKDAKQNYGMNTVFLEKIATYWQSTYLEAEHLKKRQDLLNKFPQYKTKIQGLDIHYLHVKPKLSAKDRKKIIPLLLVHGWPGSIREFYDIIPILTTPKEEVDFVFEVIAPSLPGYGFSEATTKQGLGPPQIATIFKNLMKRLGFGKYYVQGGDWGALVVSNMGALYPQHVLGLHSNMCFINSPLSNLKTFIGSLWPSLIVGPEHQDKMYPLSKIYSYILTESGYMHLQATKPDTVGVALHDSPIGLAAYILEKFSTWTEPAFKNRTDAGLSLKYDYADLIDNVMIYWVSNSITTSMRLYSEAFTKKMLSEGYDRIPIKVPSACARFSNELVYQPDCILKERYQNIVHSSDNNGGHFAAFEVPEVLAYDIWTSIKIMEESASEKPSPSTPKTA